MGSENINIVFSENLKNAENDHLASNENATSEVNKCTELENIENASTSNEDVCPRKNENLHDDEYSVKLTENENDRKFSTSTKSEIECLENVENMCEMYSNTSTLRGNEYSINNEIGDENFSNVSTSSKNDIEKNIECNGEMHLNTSTISEQSPITSKISENECLKNKECGDEMHLNASTISEQSSITSKKSENECLKNKECGDEMHLNASTISENEYLKNKECSDEMHLNASLISESEYSEKYEIIDIEKYSSSMNINDIERFARNESMDFEKYSDVSMVSGNEFLGINEKVYRGSKESSDNEKNEHLQNSINSQRQRSVTFNIFPQFVDTVPNEISKRSVGRYFCCGSLTDGAVASANYTIVLSVIFILITCHQFFRSAGDEEGTMKALCFCGICYAICYIKCGSRMKLAVDEERRDKLLPWIIFSIITIFSLMSGIIYICMNNWDELDDFHEDLTMPCLLLVLISFLILIECTLVYCTWGVVRLFKSMGFVPNYSVMDGIRMFTSGVAV